MKKVACILTLTYLFTSILSTYAFAETDSDPYLKNIEISFVQGGCFQMGSVTNHLEHEVCVSDFHISKHEVTQGVWYAVMKNNPSHFQLGPNYPVEMVSWEDTQVFIKELNRMSGKNFRLPTEAEWEYACLSGGKDEKFCGSNNAEEVAWYDDNGGKTTKEVGTKKPNGLGLYDMSGNVEEWVQDWFGRDYYASSPKNNPTGPTTESHKGYGHVVRGGEWHCGDAVLLAAKRHSGGQQGSTSNRRGFRLVLTE